MTRKSETSTGRFFPRQPAGAFVAAHSRLSHLSRCLIPLAPRRREPSREQPKIDVRR